MSVRYQPEIIAAVINQLLGTKKPSTQIARELQISPQTLSRIASDNDIDLNARRGVWGRGTQEDLWSALKHEIETTGDPLPEIAERVGTSLSRLYSLASDHKYSLRGYSKREKPKTVVNTQKLNQMWRPAAVRGS